MKRWAVWRTLVVGKQGNPMLKRLRVVQTPWFGIYLHFIYREDLDPYPHDHPWRFWRVVLRGGYVENYLTDPRRGTIEQRPVLPWCPSRFPIEHAHRIASVLPHTTTLVVVGPKVRTWGFWGSTEDATPRSWRPYHEVLDG